MKPFGPHHFASWFGSVTAPKTIGRAAGPALQLERELVGAHADRNRHARDPPVRRSSLASPGCPMTSPLSPTRDEAALKYGCSATGGVFHRRAPVAASNADTIPLTPDRTLRVLGVRDDDADQPPALIVEDLPGSAKSDAA